MATAAVVPAQHLPSKPRKPVTQRQPFDATILCAKLVASQPGRDNVQPRPLGTRDASRRSAYIPQHAAIQFVSTTSPMNRDNAMDVKRTESTAPRRQSSFTADGKPCLSPKRLRKALGLAESGSEAIASGTVSPKHLSLMESPRMSAERQQCRRSTEKPFVKPGYRPGDAAKRNTEKRLSKIAVPQGTFVRVKHGSQTLYQQESIPRHVDQIVEGETECLSTLRPKFSASDRPDWAQQSQCGEDMQGRLRKDFGQSEATTAVDCALTGWKTSRPQAASTDSVASASATLISDAVKHIKRAEKMKRRKSIMGLFKRS